MEEDLQESSVDKELQLSNTEVTQEERDEDPPQNRDLDQVFLDTESFKQEQLSLHSDQDQVVVQDEDGAQEDVDVGDQTCLPDPPEDQIQVQEVNQNPLEVHDGCQQVEEETQESDLSLVNQDLFGAEQIQDQDQDQTADLDRVWASSVCLPQASLQDQNQAEHHLVHHDDSDLDQALMGAAANQDEAGEPGGSVPALVVTQAEESPSAPAGPPVSPVEPPEKPADLVTPAAVNLFTEPSLSSSSDGGDMTCSDLLSLRSDSLSLASEPTISRRSEEDDTRSVTASSVMSLFHRVQLDPLEKDWWRSSALGNMAAQRQLLAQDPGLVLKKDFITGFTALHWAAKQGRQEAVDMMLRSGADVNVRSHGTLKPASEIITGGRRGTTGAAAATPSTKHMASQVGASLQEDGLSVTLCRRCC